MRRFTPPQIIVGSFALVGLIGTLLLSLPLAARGKPVSAIDALFTAISALCVTGLTVMDIGTRLTLFGQMVLLGLIQAGGLGLMTFSVVFLTLLGRRLSFRGREAFHEALGQMPSGEILRLVKAIFFFTLITEVSGAGLLLYRWWGPYPFLEALRYAIFHSVSAFNNAGFSLFRDNLVAYRGDATINLIIPTLIIAGGIGFLVVVNGKDFIVNRLLRRPGRRLTLHSKLVLLTTLLLIVGGATVFFLLEFENSLRGLPMKEKVLASYFQSVTPRTAGFNTIDFGRASSATLFFTILLMFVGASPGSTGGGIKTSTIGVIGAAAAARIKGLPYLHLFRRTVPEDVVSRAMAIAATNLAIVTFGTFILILVELGNLPHGSGRAEFLEFFFEVTSALGTVGLSTGITPGLSVPGKLMLAAIMFLGRVGPLTMALALKGREPRGALKYAEERILVG